MEFHPIAECFPLLEGPELIELAADIEKHGLRHPIITLDGMILDGRNRYNGCEISGVQPVYKAFDGDDPIAFVASVNVHRRQMTAAQKAIAAGKIANLPAHRPAKEDLPGRKITPPTGGVKSMSTESAARLTGASTRATERAKTVIRDSVPEVVKSVERGETTIREAEAVSKLPKEEQKQALADKRAGKTKRLTPVTPQKPAQVATTVLDAIGCEVPVGLQDAFAVLPKFQEAMSLLKQLGKLSNEIASLPGGEQYRKRLALHVRAGKEIFQCEYQKNAHTELKSAAPHSSHCPYCTHAGKIERKCPSCLGLGWVTKTGFDTAPADYRAVIEAMKSADALPF